MRRIDLDALARCIETMRNSANPADREQIEDKLKAEPWIEAAELAAYSWQFDALRLKPWQSPPCWVHPRGRPISLRRRPHLDAARLVRTDRPSIGPGGFCPV
jgi:hypothetical protein